MRTVSQDPDDPHRYDDMLDMPHHQSGTRKHMSMEQRAAQFSPFAALTGYDEAIQESSRMTMPEIELSEEEQEVLNHRLSLLSMHVKENPEVTVTWFQEDPYKEGGSYRQKTVQVRNVDTIAGCLVLSDRSTIAFSDILGLESELFEEENQ